jgi:hypothetical protein
MSTGPLPPLYQRWIDEAVQGPLPGEARATCLDCAMCGDLGVITEHGGFRPDTKCCTYIPALPSFAAGGILSDRSPEASPGRASLIARIERRVAVSPLGVDVTEAERALYDVERPRLGRSLHVRCPHYLDDGGLCGIWRYRNAVCSTWFCKHERGAAGFALWRAVETTLQVVEESLGHWCLLELDVGAEAIAMLVVPERRQPLSALPSPAVYRTAWGRWYGREHDYYVACGEKVAALSWSDVLAIGGARLAAAARVLADASAGHASREVPARAHLAPLRVLRIGAETSHVATYSPNDTVTLPTALLDALRAFDGRSTEDARAAIAEDHALAISDDLIIKLVDFAVLAPIPEEPGTDAG